MATNKEVQQSSDASNSGYNLRSRGPTLISPVSQDHAHTVAENVPAPAEEQPVAVNAQPPENIAENPENIAENPANIAENPENIAVVANNQNEAVMADQAMTAVSLRPAAFGGNQDVARQWWASFVRYIKLAKIEDAQRANLLGLLLSGTALLWFDGLTDEIKANFNELEAAFKEKYITAGPNHMQRQMQTLSRSQKPTETVDEYIADAKAKMATYQYDDRLQITLLLNGLRPEIKAITMQHMPFASVDALATKAKHVEAALKSYLQMTTPTPAPATEVQVGATFKEDAFDMKEIKKVVDEAVKPLSTELSVLAEKVRPRNFAAKGFTRPPGPGIGRGHGRAYPTYRGNQPPHRNDDKQCYICGSAFHLKRDCPRNRPTPRRGRGGGGNRAPRFQPDSSRPGWGN